MKQIYIFSLFSLLCITNLVAQTTFDWENSTDNGATIEQTVNTITATFTVSSSDPLLTNASGFAGSSGFAALSSRAYVDTNAIITFSSPINVTSLFAFNGDSGGPDTYWTFIPSGGTNSNVVAYIPGAYGVPVALNWTNITQIEITSASASGTDWFGFDNIVSDFNLSTTCTVNIPDANFKAYLVGNTAINTNGDTEIQCSEATAFNGIINCASLNISDLTGVEAFTALTELYCNSNQLANLDVSANTSLQYLFCGFNQLTSLDVSSNTALISINCRSNQLASLDGSVSPALTQLKCQDNQLTSLDVANNTALIYFECYNNSITNLDLSANTALTSITSYANNLASLNIANGFNTNLTFLSTGNNPSLTCIQVDANIVGTSPNNWFKDVTATYSASCTACAVNIPDANFKAYLVGNTAINTNGDTEIQCSEASAFTGEIFLYNLGISDLTGIEAFTALTQLTAANNQLTSLDVSANIALEELFCNGNQLTSLDVSTNTALNTLYCNDNQLTSLDVSAHSDLVLLDCNDNQLTSLNLANSNNANMYYFDATNNTALTCIEVDAAIVGTTPTGWSKDAGATYSANCATATPITYVNLSATGNNDGTSWADAYTSLQDALINSPASNDIWVAKGTYKPHASDVDVSFIANNAIYGGFAGTETDVSDRDLSLIHTTNETILSGDLNNDDATTIGFNDTTRDDNSKHVLEIAITNLEVNGFTIKDGNANGTGDDRFGAGIYKEKIAANTTIKNCVIKNNVSSTSGAGLAITSLDDSIIIIDACVIENNLSPAGSGIDYHMSTPGKTMNITVTNSLFNANKTDDNGGIKGTGASAARFRAYYSGVTLTTTLVNNTFVNNSSKGDSGNNPAGNFPVVGLSKNSGDFGTLIIANNIFWDNVTNGNTTALATGKTAAISGFPVSYDFLGNNTDESNYLSSNNTNPNLDANFKLTAASTTEIDGGVNNQIPTGITTDLAGNQRVFNTTVDRGVYEFGSTPLSVDNFFIEDEISIYPNPATSVLNIKMDSNLKRATIYSVLGAKVLETTSKNITTSNLKRGLYLIKIEDEDGSISTKRFLKK